MPRGVHTTRRSEIRKRIGTDWALFSSCVLGPMWNYDASRWFFHQPYDLFSNSIVNLKGGASNLVIGSKTSFLGTPRPWLQRGARLNPPLRNGRAWPARVGTQPAKRGNFTRIEMGLRRIFEISQFFHINVSSHIYLSQNPQQPQREVPANFWWLFSHLCVRPFLCACSFIINVYHVIIILLVY